jgi:CopG family nickel-responsive transcriptional regulator
MKEDRVRFGVSLSSDLLHSFDRWLAGKGFPSRSKAIADLVARALGTTCVEDKDRLCGVIVLSYDHHQRLLQERMTDLQHRHHHLVMASQHIHLNESLCLESIVVKGSPKEINDLTDALRREKGVLSAVFQSAYCG